MKPSLLVLLHLSKLYLKVVTVWVTHFITLNPFQTLVLRTRILICHQNPLWRSFGPFIHGGFVSLTSDLSNASPIRILRDAGASQSILLTDTLPFSEESSVGANVLIKGVDSSDYTPVPLHNVYLSSNVVSGPVTLGIRSSLPFEGVHLLLGNDLAGDKVVVSPIIYDKPCFDQVPDPMTNEHRVIPFMCCYSSHE